MTPSELRAAAERIVAMRAAVVARENPADVAKRLYGCGLDVVDNKALTDILAVANGILATVRDDDDFPIDSEWAAPLVWSPKEIDGFEVVHYPGCVTLRKARSPFMGVCVDIPVKTRGQVRDLCRALQIELKETP